MLLFLGILAALIVGNAIIDWYRIEKKEQSFTKQMYKKKQIIRASIMFVNAVLAFVFGGLDFGIWKLISLMSLQSSTFWTLFDALLNVLRGKDIDYVGKTADSDKWFQDNPKMQFIAKFLYLILSIVVSIYQLS